MFNEFFLEIDKKWKPYGTEPILLPLIGSVALFLQTTYNRGTKDSDILEIGHISPEISKALIRIAGPKTITAKRHGLYIDIVKSGIPFLPPKPLFHPLETLNQQLTHFQLNVLDVTDVVVSKLKTFRPYDFDDIRSVIELELINSDKLTERFKLAVDHWLMDARASDLPQYVKNLHTVQRDLLGVEMVNIELPSWIDT